MQKIIVLDCACCGGVAPAYKQWHNRDAGYGVCKSCFDEQVNRYGVDYAVDLYGHENIHHSLYINVTISH